MKTYDQAPEEVRDRITKLIRRFHPDLEKVQVRIDLLMASTDAEDAHAVTLGGYPCYAVVKILGPKERAMERGDAEIVIDRDEYEAMTPERRDALLDHELYHLEIRRDKVGQPKRDDHQRPLLKMRKHDFNVGWFHEIARRHGVASIEVSQALSLREEQGQAYFDFDPAVAATAGFRELCKEEGTSVTITTPGIGTGVRIDAAGIHSVGEEHVGEEIDEGTIDEATMIIQSAHVASVSVLQRRMRIGYNRASRIMAELERRGIVGPEIGSSPREILKQATESACVTTGDGRQITPTQMVGEIKQMFAKPAA